MEKGWPTAKGREVAAKEGRKGRERLQLTTTLTCLECLLTLLNKAAFWGFFFFFTSGRTTEGPGVKLWWLFEAHISPVGCSGIGMSLVVWEIGSWQLDLRGRPARAELRAAARLGPRAGGPRARVSAVRGPQVDRARRVDGGREPVGRGEGRASCARLGTDAETRPRSAKEPRGQLAGPLPREAQPSAWGERERGPGCSQAGQATGGFSYRYVLRPSSSSDTTSGARGTLGLAGGLSLSRQGLREPAHPLPPTGGGNPS